MSRLIPGRMGDTSSPWGLNQYGTAPATAGGAATLVMGTNGATSFSRFTMMRNVRSFGLRVVASVLESTGGSYSFSLWKLSGTTLTKIASTGPIALATAGIRDFFWLQPVDLQAGVSYYYGASTLVAGNASVGAISVSSTIALADMATGNLTGLGEPAGPVDWSSLVAKNALLIGIGL